MTAGTMRLLAPITVAMTAVRGQVEEAVGQREFAELVAAAVLAQAGRIEEKAEVTEKTAQAMIPLAVVQHGRSVDRHEPTRSCS